MSLNGKIMVNDQPVGYWEAVRKDRIVADTYRYDCALYYRNSEGHPLHAEFTVVHYTGSGAVALATQVLGTGIKKLKGYPPGMPKEFPV